MGIDFNFKDFCFEKVRERRCAWLLLMIGMISLTQFL